MALIWYCLLLEQVRIRDSIELLVIGLYFILWSGW